MRNINSYKNVKGAETRIDYLKYELNNVYGYNLDSIVDNSYNEDKIIKKVRDFTKREK